MNRVDVVDLVVDLVDVDLDIDLVDVDLDVDLVDVGLVDVVLAVFSFFGPWLYFWFLAPFCIFAFAPRLYFWLLAPSCIFCFWPPAVPAVFLSGCICGCLVAISGQKFS